MQKKSQAKRGFGQFITRQRKKHKISCNHLAQKAGISTGYLSQLEHGIRTNPEPCLLLQIAAALDLSPKEAEKLFDLYARDSGNLPPDITAFLTGNPTAQKALRLARDAHFTEEEWNCFIERLKK